MATCKEPDKGTDITKCPICLEKYTIPKYLPCLHTFCENCILTYSSKEFEKETKRAINCPICRSEALLLKENTDVEGWAKSLPLNILVVGLMERDKLECPDKNCMICARIDVRSKAQYVCLECSDLLCLNCGKIHRATKTLESHTLKKIEDTCIDELQTTYLFQNKCNIHANKDLELFCIDHEEACCSMCVSIHHRKCEKVLAIEDAALDFASESKVQDLKTELAEVETDIDALLANRNNCNQELANQYEICKNKQETVFSELIAKVNELKTQRESELQKLFDQSSDSVDTIVTILTCLKTNIDNEKEILDASINKASPAQVMIEMQRVRRRLTEHRKRIEDVGPEINDVALSLKNTDLFELIKSLNKILEAQVNKKASQVRLSSILDKEIYTLIRLKNICESLGWNVDGSSKDVICFKTSEDIELCGFMSYVCRDNKSPLNVTASVKENTTELVTVSVTIDSSKHEENKHKIMFPSPVVIQANKTYHAVVLMKGNQCFKGIDGQTSVNCHGVIFTFEHSGESTNSTSVTGGQIPGFLFRRK